MKALNRYQDLGYDFLAYAKPHIKKAISKTIRKINCSFYVQFLQKCLYYPLNPPTYNPHQVWLKQVNH
ncbi:MAG: hypothetical protein Q8807_02485 ['Waltheria sp.' little leaf phytoplasma]|nr:hypothetical protein ['Waltheria sp.' little leaf phytoplasma]